MGGEETDGFLLRVALLCFLILITGRVVIGNSIETDRQVLLELRSFLERGNPVLMNQRKYIQWNPQDSSPCNWPGISCDGMSNRVTGIDLFECNIAGSIFPNFSAITELTYLDLSGNTIDGVIPEDLGQCWNLKFLNLSHNIMHGALNFTALGNLKVLDLSLNRFEADISLTIPENCDNLVVANISDNNFTGIVGGIFEKCWNLKYLDLSANRLGGEIWSGFDRIEEFSISNNTFSGPVPSSVFTQNCSLWFLDLSDNELSGEFPAEISHCNSLEVLSLWGNNFRGLIPKEIGSLPRVEMLYLGSNNFSRDVPETLLGLSNLNFLDLSGNGFGGDIQEIFGRFTQVKFLLLHKNSYTGGIYSSGVLKLPNLDRLDLSYNNFSGPLPVEEISQMTSLRFLILAYNQFTGSIPSEYGNLSGLQALDLSFNRLNGSIPPSLGNLTSLLWLMLANNSLTREIPPEIGNCSSLLWLNLANNQLSGSIPPQLTSIGMNATPTFLSNRKNNQIAGSGECLAMKRWIPADYPPFSFVYKLLTRKTCRSLWDRILKGYGLFSVCLPGSNIQTTRIFGYVQLTGNQLSGEVPSEIGRMLNISMLHLGFNQFSGKLPSEIGQLPLVVLSITRNAFSGEIPWRIGNLKCLQNLDLSYNNFSGAFPTILNNLSELSKFNISYNPLISGVIPTTGQLATFEKWSFLGNPLLRLPSFMSNATKDSAARNADVNQKPKGLGVVLFALILASFTSGLAAFIVCLVMKSPVHKHEYLLEDLKGQELELASSSGASSPWLPNTIKVIRLDKTAFTHSDILKATRSFSDDRIIGRGGSGTVYRGVLPDGREVAIKKLRTEGIEGEREFRAEMEVLSGTGFGWPHPNLVPLYGWCLDGSEKLLVYEYMEGGSLEDLITNRISLNWRRRIDIAVDVAHALVFLHHECFPSIVHRDVKASNVLLDKNGNARITDFGLARVFDAGGSHVTTMVAGTVGYVAPEYGQTWKATTKGDVYSYGVLVMELATGRRAVDGGEECLVEWAKRVMGDGRHGYNRRIIPVALSVSGLAEGSEYMSELLRIGIWCTSESPNSRPNMKEVLAMLFRISFSQKDTKDGFSLPTP